VKVNRRPKLNSRAKAFFIRSISLFYQFDAGFGFECVRLGAIITLCVHLFDDYFWPQGLGQRENAAPSNQRDPQMPKRAMFQKGITARFLIKVATLLSSER
jgi:hypothetical protein